LHGVGFSAREDNKIPQKGTADPLSWESAAGYASWKTKKTATWDYINRLYEQKVARPEAGLFGLLFGYFLVRSAATHSKMSLNQAKNPSLLTQAPSVHKI